MSNTGTDSRVLRPSRKANNTPKITVSLMLAVFLLAEIFGRIMGRLVLLLGLGRAIIYLMFTRENE